VWHDLECGDYTADIALWLELAGSSGGPVLDVGAGTGRVACALARAGFEVWALERDPLLLAALAQREGAEKVARVSADARAFSLSRDDFGLCIVPMHTIQLFGDADQRAGFLRCARAHLRTGGVLAAAILTRAEPFDAALSHVCPAPERATVEGRRYVSAPTRVAVERSAIVIERERTIAGELRAEARAAGLWPRRTRFVPATEDHVGSEVVLAHA
jgi:SAM-dependent methyltransferase